MLYKLEMVEIMFELKVAPLWSPDYPVPSTAIFFRGAKMCFGAARALPPLGWCTAPYV
jgi:hypothetical protein